MSLFTGIEGFEELEREYTKIAEKPERIRYEIPTYEKFYTVYQYDRFKFRELMNNWLKSEEGKHRTLESLRRTQEEILKQCYILDENKKPKRDCDEKHIFRTRNLQRIHELIFQEIMFKRMSGKILKTDLITIRDEEQQAELKDTWNMSLYERIKIHIRLLKRLRGVS
jgi:hypothetical protein